MGLASEASRLGPAVLVAWAQEGAQQARRVKEFLAMAEWTGRLVSPRPGSSQRRVVPGAQKPPVVWVPFAQAPVPGYGLGPAAESRRVTAVRILLAGGQLPGKLAVALVFLRRQEPPARTKLLAF